MTEHDAKPQLGGHPNWEALRDGLLIQCDERQALRASKIADRPNSGMIITPKYKGPADALHVAEYLLDRGYRQPVLIDAGRYAGKNRITAADPFDATFMARQRTLGLPPVTDSGYIGQGDHGGLRSIVKRAHGDGAIAMLPVHVSFLTDPGSRAALIDTVADHGVLAAIAVEHESDPFQTRRAVTGLLEIVAAIKPMLIRSDPSALGALCYGAYGSAIGTRTSLRHIYPVPKDGNGGHPPVVAAAIGRGLTYVSLQKIFFAQQSDPDNIIWTCNCNVCMGNGVGALFTISDPEVQATRAFEHSLETILDLRDELCGGAATSAERRASWLEHCRSAQFAHFQVNSTHNSWKPPKFLGAWQNAIVPQDLHEHVR